MPEKKRAAPRRRKRKYTPYFGPAVLFFITLGLVTLLAWSLPLRPAVSEKEKRELEKFPDFSLSAAADGSYFEKISLWFSDTFPLRDSWIGADQAIKRLHGSSDIVIYGDTESADEIPAAVPTAVPSAVRGRRRPPRRSNGAARSLRRRTSLPQAPSYRSATARSSTRASAVNTPRCTRRISRGPASCCGGKRACSTCLCSIPPR